MKTKTQFKSIILLAFVLVAIVFGGWYLTRKAIEVNSYLGDYYMGDGFFVCKLSLRANRTFSVLFVQDNSVSKEFNGTFVIHENYIEMHSEELEAAQGICYAKKFVLVKWENHRYLFLHDDDERSTNLRNQFCKNVTRKTELDRETQGSFYMYINVVDKEKISETQSMIGDSPTTLNGFLFCQEE